MHRYTPTHRGTRARRNTLISAVFTHRLTHTVHTHSHKLHPHICMHSPIPGAKGETAHLAWCHPPTSVSFPHGYKSGRTLAVEVRCWSQVGWDGGEEFGTGVEHCSEAGRPHQWRPIAPFARGRPLGLLSLVFLFCEVGAIMVMTLPLGG